MNDKLKKISEAKAKLEERRLNTPDDKLRETLTKLKEDKANSQEL